MIMINHKVLKYTSKVSIVHGIWYNKFKSLPLLFPGKLKFFKIATFAFI